MVGRGHPLTGRFDRDRYMTANTAAAITWQCLAGHAGPRA